MEHVSNVLEALGNRHVENVPHDFWRKRLPLLFLIRVSSVANFFLLSLQDSLITELSAHETLVGLTSFRCNWPIGVWLVAAGLRAAGFGVRDFLGVRGLQFGLPESRCLAVRRQFVGRGDDG